MKEKKAVFKRMGERERELARMKIVVEAGCKERMREKRTLKFKGKFFIENQKKTNIVGKMMNTGAYE